MQLTLIQLEEKPTAPAVWERIAGANGKIDTVHRHVASGWTVEHCGHPTANFPYVIFRPDGERILAPNGRGFQRLRLAQQYVENHAKAL